MACGSEKTVIAGLGVTNQHGGTGAREKIRHWALLQVTVRESQLTLHLQGRLHYYGERSAVAVDGRSDTDERYRSGPVAGS